jgi:hypothetical protein
MKAFKRGNHSDCNIIVTLIRAFVVAVFLLALLPTSRALSIGPGDGGPHSGPAYTPLDSWSFNFSGWLSDRTNAPISFTNLDFSQLGNGASLVVNSTNAAWLRYNVVETNGTTNLTVNAGTVMFWFAPSWSSVSLGGTGPQESGRLIETGAYTTDSSLGWWSLYVDPAGANLYFSTQTNDLSGTYQNYITVPIAWKTNYFHFVALTYSATNTTLYLDGSLATNGPPLAVYPGTNALADGLYFGSDTNGAYQAQGLFNSVATYNVPMDGNTVLGMFNQSYPMYLMNPWNVAMFLMNSAISNPSFGSSYAAISGAGNLQWDSYLSGCVPGTSPNQVWFTNITATASSNGTMNVTFSIVGGASGYFYDVFATSYLQSPITNSVWVWLGQGIACNRYKVNIPSANAFLILGTPQDTALDGITDAYSLLVDHLIPNPLQTTDSFGVPYAWYVQNGLSVTSALLDPDQDDLLNFQEYLYGTNPDVSEGMAVWTTGGNSSIP